MSKEQSISSKFKVGDRVRINRGGEIFAVGTIDYFYNSEDVNVAWEAFTDPRISSVQKCSYLELDTTALENKN